MNPELEERMRMQAQRLVNQLSGRANRLIREDESREMYTPPEYSFEELIDTIKQSGGLDMTEEDAVEMYEKARQEYDSLLTEESASREVRIITAFVFGFVLGLTALVLIELAVIPLISLVTRIF